MRTIGIPFVVMFLAVLSTLTAAFGQTAGSARMEVTLLDYTGTSGSSHYTVAWVTTGSGTFVKSLRKQGPSNWASSEWNSHCLTWNTARAGSTAIDGYTSATASNYSGTNSPVILTWNGRDASNNLMPDGQYKFWVQYAENSGQGPYTSSGLLWNKGPVAATNTYPNQGANFANMRVTWMVNAPPTIISSTLPATATVGVPYSHVCTATGSPPLTFAAQGLPPGLSMSTAGVVSGKPTSPGAYTGTVIASNGMQPNATQAFSIAVDVVPTSINAVEIIDGKLVMSGTGPANGTYRVLTASSPDAAANTWQALATNTFSANGAFRHTNTISTGLAQQFFQLRIP